MNSSIEVEIKIRLNSEDDYKTFKNFIGLPYNIDNQINYYLDSPNSDIVNSKSVLRLRIINNNRAVITFKGKLNLINGIAKNEEIEEDINLDLAKLFINNPNQYIEKLYNESELLKKIYVRFNILTLNILGSITTNRSIYNWNNHKLELDDSDYGFAKNYEIEIETSIPDQIKSDLETLLINIGVAYSYNKTNKFGHFINKKIII
jgi:uncharacterized protein YjbK